MLPLALATEADVAQILEISNWAAANSDANFATAPEPLDTWLATFRGTQAQYPWIVARDDDRVLGFAKAGPYRARGAYRWTAETSIYLRPEAHGRGLGTRLYALLLPMLRDQGFCTVFAGVVAGHRASERLHAKAGFRSCLTLHRAGHKNGRWLDVGFWELHLREDDAPPPDRLRTVAEVWPAHAPR